MPPALLRCWVAAAAATTTTLITVTTTFGLLVVMRQSSAAASILAAVGSSRQRAAAAACFASRAARASTRRPPTTATATATKMRLSPLAPPAAEGSATGAPADEAVEVMRNALFRVRDVNKKPPPDATFLDFVVDGTKLGRVSTSNADLLIRSGGNNNVFCASTQGSRGAGSQFLTFSGAVGSTFEERTAAVAAVTGQLKESGHLKGWRDELYPVSQSFYDPPVFAMERAAVPWLGALEYGVHVNGLVEQDKNDGDGGASGPNMWMARRSRQKSKFPGMLDHLVAGGQPLGMSLLDNVIKECHEEAGISERLARRGLRPASAISYETYVASSQTISRAVLFNYDLYLPSTFVPVPVDGEVDEFFLWTVDELFASLDPNYPDPIKPNCYSGA
jgi:Domain of unknown function (DUF4743)